MALDNLLFGTVTLLSRTRLGPGSSIPASICPVVGLYRLRHPYYSLRLEGSNAAIGSSIYARIYGGMGTAVGNFTTQIGSIYAAAGASAKHTVFKEIATAGAPFIRARIFNASGGTFVANVKLVLARELDNQ